MNKIYILTAQDDAYEFIKQKLKENFDIENPVILKTEKGKPYIENGRVCFNVSHSANLKVVAIGNSEVGIDVELLRRVDLSVARRFTQEEYNYITQTDSNNRFFEIWTKKEAYLKYKGMGISGGLSSFNVLEMPQMFQTFLKNGYIITVCSDEKYRIED